MAEKKEKETVKKYKDLTSTEKLRLMVRYKGWFESCMKGDPLRSPIFTNAAAFIANVILERPQETEEEIEFAETYQVWFTSCMEGKPLLDEESVKVALEVRKMFLSPDGHSYNPEFG